MNASARAPSRPENASSPAVWLAFGLVLVCFSVWAGDRIGWEGDDLASMFGITYLDTVGRDHVYRYAWQPWSYEALHALGRFGLGRLDLTYAGNVAGMAGLALLAALLDRSMSRRVPLAWLTAVVLVLMAPELWITPLYFNTTAIALPFFGGSLLCLQHLQERPADGRTGTALASGVLFGISCLMRMDFATAGLFLIAMIGVTGPHPRRIWVAWLLGAFALPFVAVATSQGLLPQIIRIGRGYEDGQTKWGPLQSIKVLLIALGPALVIAPLLLLGRRPAGPPAAGAGRAWRITLVIGLLPMLIPLKNLFSGKYLVPLACCLLWLAARDLGRRSALGALPRRWGTRVGTSVAVLVLTAVVSLVPDRSRGTGGIVDAVLAHPHPFFTHDGARTLGGYAAFAGWMHGSERPQYIASYTGLADMLDRCPEPAIVVFPPDPKSHFNDAWSWGWIPLHLAQRGWQLTHYEPTEQVDLRSPRGDRSVSLMSPARHAATAAGKPPAFDLGQIHPLDGEPPEVADARVVAETLARGACWGRTPATAP